MGNLRYYMNDNTIIDLEKVSSIRLVHGYPDNHVYRGCSLYQVVVDKVMVEVVGNGLMTQFKKYYEIEEEE